MSSTATHEHIAGLLTTFNIEIGSLPDGLKCGQCRGVLKDACQVPCGCRFCRLCIDEEVARGTQFCPGGAQECDGTPLSTAHRDYRANKTISRLTGNCPHAGCCHECPLADMEGHLRVCPRESMDCLFRELGCQQDKLTAEEMSGHLLQESRSHSAILIRLVANINREMAVMKLDIEASKQKSETLKGELVLRDEQMKSIMGELRNVQNENISNKCQIKSMKNENKSMKSQIKSIERETEVLSERVLQLAEKLDRVNTICHEWLIAEDVSKVDWWGWSKTSDKFRREGQPLTYQLLAQNIVSAGVFSTWLRIWAGPSDALLEWPFRGAVSVTVADMERRQACSSLTQQCRIERPPKNQYRSSEQFTFEHAALRAASLDLKRGVRVSCRIVLD